MNTKINKTKKIKKKKNFQLPFGKRISSSSKTVQMLKKFLMPSKLDVSEKW